METFPERLRKALDARGLTQAELSARADIDKGSISCYLSGRYKPKHPMIVKLCNTLRVNPMWLMGYCDEPMDLIPGSFIPSDTKEIPVLGTVAAGRPVYAEENIIGAIRVDPRLGDDLFALVIKGDSMSPRICDGDTVIVRRQEDAESGQIVVVVVGDDDATCKKLQKFPGGLSLVPLNPIYEPMIFSDEQSEDVHIIGRVVENRQAF